MSGQPRENSHHGGRGGYSNNRAPPRDSGRGYPTVEGMAGTRGRGDDRGYYGRGGGSSDRVSSWRRGDDNSNNDDREGSWRCQECGTFNDFRSHTYCKKCDGRKSRRGSEEGRQRFEAAPPYDERRHRSVSESSAGGGGGNRLDRRADGHRSSVADGRDYYGPAASTGSCRRRENEDSFSAKEAKRQKLEKNRKSKDADADEGPRWPPPFEKDGAAAYIFDARSSYFYEAGSDFFYDPKTKLYYGNKQGSYFRHVPGGRPPYLAVSSSHHQQQHDQPQIGSGEGAAATSSAVGAAGDPPVNPASVVASPPAVSATPSISSGAAPSSAQAKASSGSSASKKKIEISLKRSSKQAPDTSIHSAAVATAPSNVAAAVLVQAKEATRRPKAAEKHDSDIAKWSERQRENQRKDKSEAAPTSVLPLQQTTTKKGEPICFLCKRKFASLEKLRQHEQVSALHKQNLSKKKKTAEVSEAKKISASATKASGSSEYRDRAKDRRVLYCPDPSESHSHKADEPLELGPSLEKARAVTATEVVKPHEILGDSNIGSKMLQKLGWKKGASLGRKLDSSCEGKDEGQNSIAENHELKKDWEKIESIASGNARVVAKGGIGDSGVGRMYKG